MATRDEQARRDEQNTCSVWSFTHSEPIRVYKSFEYDHSLDATRAARSSLDSRQLGNHAILVSVREIAISQVTRRKGVSYDSALFSTAIVRD